MVRLHRLLALQCLLGVGANDDVDALFKSFVTDFNKTYASVAEYARRKTVFAASLQSVAEANSNSDDATFGITQFSDLTETEFAKQYLSGYRRPRRQCAYGTPNNGCPQGQHCSAGQCVPNSLGLTSKVVAAPVDWRSKGVVTPVKNQGHCGSCWAFSVVEQVESQAAMQGIVPKGTELSVEEIVDCDDFSHGCQGGSPETAYDQITIGGGLTSAKTYGPYIGNATEKCHFAKSSALVTATDYPSYKTVSSSAGEENAMIKQISNSPMAICVQADLWKQYKSGVITAKSGCGGQTADALNHCVQVVGVGEQNQSQYWIVRNSWGSSFGNDGYVYLAMGSNVCGIAMEATIAKGLSGPAPTEVVV